MFLLKDKHKEKGERITMAREVYSDLLEQDNVEIEDKYLVIETDQDGYFAIYQGLHPYKIIKEGNEYSVFPTEWTKEGKLTNKPLPIIRSIDEDVFFIKGDRNDPYNAPEVIEINDKDISVEKRILDAFNAYAQTQYSLGQNPIYVFITDGEETGLEDTKIDFVFRKADGEFAEEEDEEKEDGEE